MSSKNSHTYERFAADQIQLSVDSMVEKMRKISVLIRQRATSLDNIADTPWQKNRRGYVSTVEDIVSDIQSLNSLPFGNILDTARITDARRMKKSEMLQVLSDLYDGADPSTQERIRTQIEKLESE